MGDGRWCVLPCCDHISVDGQTIGKMHRIYKNKFQILNSSNRREGLRKGGAIAAKRRRGQVAFCSYSRPRKNAEPTGESINQ
jgi:hypothetical protein